MDATQLPKKPVKPIPDPVVKRAYKTLSLRDYLTEGETQVQLERLLQTLGTKKNAKAPWVGHLDFYKQNLSGDVLTMDAATKKRADTLVKDVRDEYLRQEE